MTEEVTHKCPICHNWHKGAYQVCDECTARRIDEGDPDHEDKYDFAMDDFNYDAARERGRR